MADMLTLWGAINKDGSIRNSGGGFNVTKQGNGQYVISFRTLFNDVPAIVGSQTNYGDLGEANTDGVVFPIVDRGSATAITGDGGGKHQDRSFSFIAIGIADRPNPSFKE